LYAPDHSRNIFSASHLACLPGTAIVSEPGPIFAIVPGGSKFRAISEKSPLAAGECFFVRRQEPGGRDGRTALMTAFTL
jgi:hypothetical protein